MSNHLLVKWEETELGENEAYQVRLLMLLQRKYNVCRGYWSRKSTLINAMANYIMGVTWADPFRFTLVNVETSEQGRSGNQTEWITCYNINTSVSSRLKYNINLIDTPGFGDTRGLDHDQTVINQIKELCTIKGTLGVATIDAVCFILKALMPV
ncbi:unnamed protein product [Mytilus edulis]|uniref:Uncharacterized protein n=1 Tax=Mytilus edulis TaxID=6550 RepID=A0A8S3UPG1_MYTED|nr:unnamed protein product [Mytilus edulis]